MLCFGCLTCCLFFILLIEPSGLLLTMWSFIPAKFLGDNNICVTIKCKYVCCKECVPYKQVEWLERPPLSALVMS